jgi:hypothetical protein
MDLYRTLGSYADDSSVEIVEYTAQSLVLSVAIDSLGGEVHRIRINEPLHVDMPPRLMLGSIVFGGRSLLPEGYERSRSKGFEGNEDEWRVMKVVDDEGNEFFALFFEDEVLE